MKRHLVGIILAIFFFSQNLFVLGISEETNNEDDEQTRRGKVFSMFQIVTFPNDVCVGGSLNGTCYTAAECTTKGGTSDGTCASGYGVCCTFSLDTDGQSSSENCTYLTSPMNAAAGSILNTICPCSTDICQMRLDFNSFVIAGPSTQSTTDVKILFGEAPTNAITGAPASLASQCLTDQFHVTSSGGITPPTICGSNSGEHMYVDATNTCIDLNFVLGSTGIGTTIPTRQWNVKVTQYSCTSPNLAPDGCTQYFYGSTMGTVRTYNYGGQIHLADQTQTICVRREAGQCQICWSAAMVTDFMVSGKVVSMGYTKGDLCCDYGATGKKTTGYDCVSIPGAFSVMKTKSSTRTKFPSHICGRNLVTASGTMGTSVCTKRTPFYIRFNSDSYEYTGAAMMAEATLLPQTGFKLNYVQSGNC